MALVTTRTGLFELKPAQNPNIVSRMGLEMWGTFAFDSSYPTGGEALAAADIVNQFPGGVEQITIENAGGYIFKWDRANAKILAYFGDNDNASDGPLIEIANTTDLSALTAVPFVARGFA